MRRTHKHDFGWGLGVFPPVFDRRGGRKIERRLPLVSILLLALLVASCGSEVQRHHRQAIRHLEKGEYEEAIADYTEAIRLDPSHAGSYNNRGNVHFELGEYEEAIADYSEAVRLDPNNAQVYFNRGLAQSRQGEYEEAIADYGEAIRLDPDDGTAYYNRGKAYRHLGEYEKAIADFESYLRLAPVDAEPWRTEAQTAIDRMRGQQ